MQTDKIKTLIKHLSLVVIGLLAWMNVNAQVTSVNYQLRYNNSTCLYDAILHVNSGSATTTVQRLQGNAQFSFVVPTGTTVTMISSSNPKRGDSTAATWMLGNPTINPASLSGYDIYPVTPTLSPTGFYPILLAGDKIVLFSLKISSVNCGAGIRMWDNSLDPQSTAPGFGGRQFDNGFTIASVTQRYTANDPTVYPTSPVIIAPPSVCLTSSLNINISTVAGAACSGPLSYSWSGPAEYTASSEDISIEAATTLNAGLYTVISSDSLGCKDTAMVRVSIPVDTVLRYTSCNPADTGTTIQNLTNSYGCDSVVTRITTLAPYASYTINATTCRAIQAGIKTDTIAGGSAYGCDSVVTTITTLLPGGDSLLIYQTINNAANADTTIQVLTNSYGCDSVVKIISILILPVELIYIKANSIENEYIQVSWATASERNSKKFEILRSTDAINFEKMGEVPAAIYSNSIKKYFYDDYNTLSGIIYYYQIREVDNDNHSHLTKIVNAKLEKDKAELISIYPNPIVDNTVITMYSRDVMNISLKVYNDIGEKMKSEQKTLQQGLSEWNVDTDKWAKGVYYFIIEYDGSSVIKQVIKIR